jgi:hypothetical protein
MMAPETLVFETSPAEIFGNDTILVQRGSVAPDAIAFIQISEDATRAGANGTSAAYLTIDDAIVLTDQLTALILDAHARGVPSRLL